MRASRAGSQHTARPRLCASGSGVTAGVGPPSSGGFSQVRQACPARHSSGADAVREQLGPGPSMAKPRIRLRFVRPPLPRAAGRPPGAAPLGPDAGQRERQDPSRDVDRGCPRRPSRVSVPAVPAAALGAVGPRPPAPTRPPARRCVPAPVSDSVRLGRRSLPSSEPEVDAGASRGCATTTPAGSPSGWPPTARRSPELNRTPRCRSTAPAATRLTVLYRFVQSGRRPT